MAAEPPLPEELELRLVDSLRVEAFSDAVFAIAMTLLAVELKPPHAESG